MMHHQIPTLVAALLVTAAPFAAALEPGDRVELSLRGVAASEREKIEGTYRVGASGTIKLPLLDSQLDARGLSPEQLARAAENAFTKQGIYTHPSIEVEVLEGEEVKGLSFVSVGGQVRRAGQTAFQNNLTVIQAIDAAGGRNDFGGRNLYLIRSGRQYCLDFRKLAHKSIRLQPGDSLQVSQKAVIDRWKGSESAIEVLKK